MSQSSSEDEDDALRSNGRSNIAAIIAVVVIAALGYWVFNTIDHARRMQNCLDSGRRDCEHRVE